MAKPPNTGPFSGDEPQGDRPDNNRAAAQNIVRQAMGQGQQVLQGEIERDPPPGEPTAGGIAPGDWTPDPMTGLPDDCPVTPLGYDNDTFYILTYRGTVTGFSGSGLNKIKVAGWFAPRSNYCNWMCPPPKTVNGKERNPDNWNHEKLATLLANSCAGKGPWSPDNNIRGLGAWKTVFGDLVYHFGDQLYVGGALRETGEHENILYPRRPRLPRPAPRAVGPAPGGGPEGWLKNLERWHWQRHESSLLMLGFTGLSMMGGAADWRSHIFVQGRKASGKTALHDSYCLLMGRAALQMVNPTAAGLYQSIGIDAIAVAIDEAEGKKAGGGFTTIGDIISIARYASSGATRVTGSKDGVAKQYTVRSCFLLTAITKPPMESQDTDRWSVLPLLPHATNPAAPPPPTQDGAQLELWGRQILRRMIDHWPRFEAVRQIYAQRLMMAESEGGAGLDSRHADQQYGHLIAAQHILLHDHDPRPSELDYWVMRLRRSDDAEAMAENDNWQDCLDYMLDATPDIWRHKAHRSVRAVLYAVFDTSVVDDSEAMGWRAAQKQLSDVGLTLVNKAGQGAATLQHCYLHVPNKHPGLSDLFKGSPWYSAPGGSGHWHSLLEQGDDDLVERRVNAKYRGVSRYGTKVRVAMILDIETALNEKAGS